MSQTQIYRTVKTNTEGLYKEKGSKFLAFVFPCNNSDDAKKHIALLWKKNPNAVHVCFAWRFGKVKFQDRFSDDDEPNNSAGKPIFGQILSFELTNILIAVVRYYGGTNLGVGGLITAYKEASKDALVKAVIEENYISDYFEIVYPYDLTGDVLNLLQKIGVDIISQNFNDVGPLTQFKVRQERTKIIQKEFSINPNYKLTLIESDK